MCEATTLALIGTTALSTGMGIAASARRAGAARQIGEYNARQRELSAADARLQGDYTAEAAALKGGAVEAAQKTMFAGESNVAQTGSAATAAATSSLFSKMDLVAIKNNAAAKARGLLADAENQRRSAGFEADAAENDMLATAISGVGRMAALGIKGWADYKK